MSRSSELQGEKKKKLSTPADRVSEPITIPQQVAPPTSDTPSIPPADQTQISEPNPLTTIVKEPTPEPTPQEAPKKELSKLKMKVGAGISNIAKITEEVAKTADLEQSNRKPLNILELDQLWNQYAQNHPSKGVQSALKSVKIDIHQQVVKVVTPTQVAKDMILQEQPLVQEIRTYFSNPQITFEFEIDPAQFPEMDLSQPRLPVTPHEKLQEMVAKNPMLVDFIDQLGLRLKS